MTLIERDEELRALDACRHGESKVVLVHGTVASGKTALLEEFADREFRAGALPLHAVASRTEQTLPFGVIRQLFSHAAPAERVGDIARLLDEGPLPEKPSASARTLEALWGELLRL